MLWAGERDTADSPTLLGGSVVSPVDTSAAGRAVCP
jgi:hypothetical protein